MTDAYDFQNRKSIMSNKKINLRRLEMSNKKQTHVTYREEFDNWAIIESGSK